MDEYERAAASKAKSGHLEKRLYPHVQWGVWNLAHFLAHFLELNELFQRTLCHPSHTNSNAHVSPVGSKVMRCARAIHCEYVHIVIVITLTQTPPPFLVLEPDPQKIGKEMESGKWSGVEVLHCGMLGGLLIAEPSVVS